MNSRSRFATGAVSVWLVACGSGQPAARSLAEPASQGSFAAPRASATSATAASAAPLDLGAVVPLSFSRGACSFSVEPAPGYQNAPDLRAVAEQLNRDGFGATLPEEDAALRERVCLADGCNSDVAPLALSMGDEAVPAAFRVGMLVRSGTTLRVYGPFDGGFQLYHCVPALSGEVRPPAFDGELLSAALEIVQPHAVGVGENGACEPELEPNCQRACFDEQVTRLDLFVQRGKVQSASAQHGDERADDQALLVTQTLRFEGAAALQVQPPPALEPVLDVASRELHFDACGERVTLRLVR